jgi:hypothetical protein
VHRTTWMMLAVALGALVVFAMLAVLSVSQTH